MKIAAIGCSFTNYIWPSYADILKADNYGLSGIGNERIWHVLCQLAKDDKLKLYDAVVVQWTSPFRFDYKTSKGWTHNDGAIALSQKNKFIWRSIKQWYNESYEIEKSANYILTAKAICNSYNVKNFHMSMTGDLANFVDLPNLKDSFRNRYEFTSAPWTDKPFKDGHPTIEDHIQIAKTIAKNIGCKLDELLVDKCVNLHKQLLTGIDFSTAEKEYKSNFPYRYIATCL